MQQDGPFSWKDNQVVKQVFIAGSIYFLLTTLYSLYHYQGKFLYDGTGLIFYITNYEWFPPAAQREVFYLQQFIPVLFAKLGLPIKWVMIGYVLNVYLLYYILFVIVSWTLRDALSGILFMLVHYQGDPYNYFIMVEELLPGACMAVVFCSIIANMDAISRKKTAVAGMVVALVFVVRSHPLALVCLAGAIPLLYLRHPGFFRKYQLAMGLLALCGAALVALKFLFLNEYDAGRISEGKSVLQSALELLQPEKFSGMVLFLFGLRNLFAIAFAAIVIFFAIRSRYRDLLVFLLVVSSTVVLFNMMTHDHQFRSWNLTPMKFDQWSLPVRFVTFVAVCFLALSEITTRQVFVYARAVIVFFFLLGAVHLADQQLVSREYLAQADFLLEQCRKQGVSKAVVRTERLKPGIPVMNTAYQDILVWSALKYPGSPVQVVYADDEYYPPVEQMSADEIILDQAGPILRHRDLNPRYYNLPEEKYREIAISGSAD